MFEKKLVVRLSGGLGNQMFQYATGRSLALANNMEFVLDDRSGFARDFQYRRSYSLSAFDVQGRRATRAERIPFWVQRLLRKLHIPVLDKILSRDLFGYLLEEGSLDDGSRRYFSEITSVSLSKSTWLNGYWQSDKYFLDLFSTLHSELSPPAPDEGPVAALGEKMRRQRSAAICIRLYEESINPLHHCRGGVVKAPDTVRHVIDKMTAELDLEFLYFFCSHNSDYLKTLAHGLPVYFVTPENGYSSELESLWLMSQCHHHLITNSSFYWWGAWLADMKWANDDQRVVYCSDNFINVDSMRSGWRQF